MTYTGRDRRRHLGITDRRLLIIYVLVVAVMGYMLYLVDRQGKANREEQSRFEQAVYLNCTQVNQANTKINELLDQLSATVQATTSLTPDQKNQAIRTYSNLHLPISTCPPVGFGS